jgi:hypothetical protein
MLGRVGAVRKWLCRVLTEAVQRGLGLMPHTRRDESRKTCNRDYEARVRILTGPRGPCSYPNIGAVYYLQNNAAQRGEMEGKQQEDGGGSRSLDPARVKKRSRQAKNRLNSASRTPQCGQTLFQVTSTKASGPRAVEARHPTVKKEALSARKGVRLAQKRRDRDPEGSLREEGLSAQPRSGPYRSSARGKNNSYNTNRFGVAPGALHSATIDQTQLSHQFAMKPHVDEE